MVFFFFPLGNECRHFYERPDECYTAPVEYILLIFLVRNKHICCTETTTSTDHNRTNVRTEVTNSRRHCRGQESIAAATDRINIRNRLRGYNYQTHTILLVNHFVLNNTPDEIATATAFVSRRFIYRPTLTNPERQTFGHVRVWLLILNIKLMAKKKIKNIPKPYRSRDIGRSNKHKLTRPSSGVLFDTIFFLKSTRENIPVIKFN